MKNEKTAELLIGRNRLLADRKTACSLAPSDQREPEDLSLDFTYTARLLDNRCRVKNEATHTKQTKSDHASRQSRERLQERTIIALRRLDSEAQVYSQPVGAR
jgi:hypothetical protein